MTTTKKILTVAIAAVALPTASLASTGNAFAKGGGHHHHHFFRTGVIFATPVYATCWKWVFIRDYWKKIYVCGYWSKDRSSTKAPASPLRGRGSRACKCCRRCCGKHGQRAYRPRNSARGLPHPPPWSIAVDACSDGHPSRRFGGRARHVDVQWFPSWIRPGDRPLVRRSSNRPRNVELLQVLEGSLRSHWRPFFLSSAAMRNRTENRSRRMEPTNVACAPPAPWSPISRRPGHTASTKDSARSSRRSRASPSSCIARTRWRCRCWRHPCRCIARTRAGRFPQMSDAHQSRRGSTRRVQLLRHGSSSWRASRFQALHRRMAPAHHCPIPLRPRNAGCDIGPLIVGACAGAASGAGMRFL